MIKLLKNHNPVLLCFFSILFSFSVVTIVYSLETVTLDTLNISKSDLKEPAWILKDEICQLLDKPLDQFSNISDEDKKKSEETLKNGWRLFQRYKKTKDMKILFESQPYFEEALILDPVNKTNRKAINGIYHLLENYYRSQKNYNQAIILGERLLRLNTNNSEEFSLYFNLGKSYFGFEENDYALFYFQKAEQLLKHIISISNLSDNKKVNNFHNYMFSILIYQNESLQKLSRPDDALKIINHAFKFVQEVKQRNILDNKKWYLERWLFWQDKEVVENEIEINKLQKEKKYGDIIRIYEKLLKKFPLFFDERRIETVIHYSSFEFQYLNEKVNAVKRLHPWITTVDDKLKQIKNIQDLYKCFSLMCYNLGVEQLEEDRFAAFCFFKQGLVVPSEYQEKISLRLLMLYQGNADEIIRLGSEIWNKREKLSDAEKKILCEYLIYAYKKSGNPEETRRFLIKYQSL